MKRVKKYIYKILNNKYFKDFQPLILVIILFIVMWDLKGNISWKDLTDIQVGLSVIIPAFVGVLLITIVQILGRSIEDINKINYNYLEIINIYNKEKPLELTFNNKLFKIPYVSIFNNINKKGISIHHKNEGYQLPEFFQIHYKDLMSFHKHSKLVNNYAIRLDKVEETEDVLNLETSITTYFNSILTNRTMDGGLGTHKC